MHIWLILDGKPGHENQSRGLCAALQRIHSGSKITIHEIIAENKLPSLTQWFLKRFPQGEKLPLPTFIIGAGHKTHLGILAAKRCYGGKSIVLMKPSLPASLFDLCIVPEHDAIPASNHVLLTKGVLNTIQTTKFTTTDRTLILVGGPSKHAIWNDKKILDQISQITNNSSKQVILSTSRRTPESFIENVKTLKSSTLEIHLAEQTPRNWLATQLSQCHEAWVSIDSVSMVYESLTAGAAVGILEIEPNKNSRVINGIKRLSQAKSVTLFSTWQHNKHLQLPQTTFNEAERCAQWINSHWVRKKNT